MNKLDKLNIIKTRIAKAICNYENCSDEEDACSILTAILNNNKTYQKCPCVRFKVHNVSKEILETLEIEWINERNRLHKILTSELDRIFMDEEELKINGLHEDYNKPILILKQKVLKQL